MANTVSTVYDTSDVVVWEPVFQDEILTDAAAVTYAAGTLLGRITASGKLTKYLPASADGSQFPVAVLRNDTDTVAGGDVPIRPIISGQVRLSKLVVAEGTPRAPTLAETEQLRDYTIIARSTRQLAQVGSPT